MKIAVLFSHSVNVAKLLADWIVKGSYLKRPRYKPLGNFLWFRQRILFAFIWYMDSICRACQYTVDVNLTGRFAIWHTYCTWHHNTRNIFPRHSFGPVEDGRPSSPYVLAYVIIATFFNLHCIHSQLYSLVYIDLHLSESIVTLNKNPKINSSNINRCRTFGCNLKIMSRNQVTKRSFQEISNGGDRDKNKRNKLGTSGWKKYSARDKSRWPEFLQMRDRKLRAEKMTYLHRIRY